MGDWRDGSFSKVLVLKTSSRLYIKVGRYGGIPLQEKQRSVAFWGSLSKKIGFLGLLDAGSEA